MAFDAYLKFASPSQPGNAGGKAGIANKYEFDKDEPTPGGNIGWIQMDEYSFGASMAVTASRSGGTGSATTGRGKLEPFTFKKSVDKTSMALAFHAAAGTVFQKIVVNIFVAVNTKGDEQVPYQFLTIVMESAIINSCKFSGGGGDDLPTEEVSINYGRIKYKYKPFTVTSTGQLERKPTTTFLWDTIANKGAKS